MTGYIVPLCLFALCLLALKKKEDGYQAMLDGAADGLRLTLSLVPTLVLLMCAVSMLRACGAVEALSKLLSPALTLVGIPAETAVLLLIRPISGSAALAVGSELILHHGANSQIGRTVAVMLGSTETTFYTISVYFGAAGIKKSRYTLPAALLADITGFIAAAFWVRLLF